MKSENSSESTPDSEWIDNDTLFYLLSNSRRRLTFHVIINSSGALELRYLSEKVAALENDVEIERVPSSERKSVYTSLQQHHLPKMDEAGVINYDHRRGVVEPTSCIENVDFYIEVVDQGSRTWPDAYLALGVVSLALAIIAAFSFIPMAAVAIFVAISVIILGYVNRHAYKNSLLGSDGWGSD